MRWTIPNVLTVVRLLAAPGLAFSYLVFERPLADIFALVLFVGAALTDYVDGFLARRLGQESRFGKMLDPIADKVMVIIALAVILGLSGLQPLIILPVTVILFREIFVSGLREFLGADAGKLQVTNLAKWKTTAQMFAIPVLFLAGVFQYQFEGIYYQLDPYLMEQILSGDVQDEFGIVGISQRYELAHWLGLVLIWIAAILTAITGWDYFTKARPYLTEEEGG